MTLNKYSFSWANISSNFRLAARISLINKFIFGQTDIPVCVLNTAQLCLWHQFLLLEILLGRGSGKIKWTSPLLIKVSEFFFNWIWLGLCLFCIHFYLQVFYYWMKFLSLSILSLTFLYVLISENFITEWSSLVYIFHWLGLYLCWSYCWLFELCFMSASKPSLYRQAKVCLLSRLETYLARPS